MKTIKVLKATTSNLLTHISYRWKPGEWQRKAEDVDIALCSNTVFHAFANEAQANAFRVLINFYDPVWWEAEASGRIIRDKTKVGATRMRLVKRVPSPLLHGRQLRRMGALAYLELGNSDLYVVAARGALRTGRMPRGCDFDYNHLCTLARDKMTEREFLLWYRRNLKKVQAMK